MSNIENNETSKTIGDYLRVLRESKNIDLKTIAFKTKINYTILKELESDNYSRIPDKTYIRGFIKSYIKEVGGDLDWALQLLESAYTDNEQMLHIESTLSQPIQDSQEARENSETPLENENHYGDPRIESKNIKVLDFFKDHKNPNIRPLVLTVLGVFVLIFSIYIVKFSPKSSDKILSKRKAHAKKNNLNDAANNVQTLISKPVITPSTVIITPTVAAANVTPVKATPRPTATATIAVTPKVTATASPTPTPTPTPQNKISPSLLNKVVEFKKIDAPLYTVVPDAKENKDPNLIPDYIKNSAAKGLENIYVNAIDGDSWVTYKSDSNDIKSFVLRKGKRLLVRGKEVKLFVGNVNAVKVFYNNKLVSASSDTGVKSFIFPETSISKYSLPLFIHDEVSGKIYTEEEFKKLTNTSNN